MPTTTAPVLATIQHVNVVFTPSATLDSTLRIIGIVLGVIWLVYLGSQFLLPKKRGGQKTEAGKIIGAAIVIMFLLNFNMFPTIVTNVINLAIDLANAASSLWSSSS